MSVIVIALKGMAVGAANVMPGISGATLAVILGIYDRLIAAINALTARGKDTRESIGRWRDSLVFLMPFGVGVVAGIITGATAVSYLLGRFSFQSAGFIAGLMAGSLPFLYGRARGGGGAGSRTETDGITHRRPRSTSPARMGDNRAGLGFGSFYMYYVAAGLAAAVIIGVTVFMGPSDAYFEGTIGVGMMALLFLGGMAGAAAMIVPGVSGAMVLVLLGIYPIAMEALSQLRVYLANPTALELLPPILRVALPVGLGIIPGVLLAGRGIAWLLERYFALTYFVIIGLVLGTVFALFNHPDTYRSGDVTLGVGLAAGVAFVGGMILALRLGKSPDVKT